MHLKRVNLWFMAKSAALDTSKPLPPPASTLFKAKKEDSQKSGTYKKELFPPIDVFSRGGYELSGRTVIDDAAPPRDRLKGY